MIRLIRYKDPFGIVLYCLFTGLGPIRILVHLDPLTTLIGFKTESDPLDIGFNNNGCIFLRFVLVWDASSF